ncbi:hypothetical protein Tsubulata_045281 [Turnera subulata]|uniref:Uncharacterized protein n=1 Tax=Turnera subulata TaxID=218843 RepID=A0A9Q0G8Q7_9ROSI|nr:hypothetical protein Tsubulata_045281 [Turnera subulata]
MEKLVYNGKKRSGFMVLIVKPCRGKAAHAMMKDMAKYLKQWEGRKVLFVHTGGLLGLYDESTSWVPLEPNGCRAN